MGNLQSVTPKSFLFIYSEGSNLVFFLKQPICWLQGEKRTLATVVGETESSQQMAGIGAWSLHGRAQDHLKQHLMNYTWEQSSWGSCSKADTHLKVWGSQDSAFPA